MEADVGFSIHFVFDEATPQLECREIALYCYGTGEVCGREDAAATTTAIRRSGRSGRSVYRLRRRNFPQLPLR